MFIEFLLGFKFFDTDCTPMCKAFMIHAILREIETGVTCTYNYKLW